MTTKLEDKVGSKRLLVKIPTKGIEGSRSRTGNKCAKVLGLYNSAAASMYKHEIHDRLRSLATYTIIVQILLSRKMTTS